MSTNNAIQLILPRPHAGQQKIIDECKRFNVVCAGRRFGKSLLGQNRLINTALLKGQPAGWFSPSYKLSSDAWRELVKTLQPITCDISQQERRIELKGGGVLEVWSLDSPDAGRGRGYAAVVIDEAALVASLDQAWQSIRPMLTDYHGQAWFLSTPKGTANTFHMLFQKSNSSSDWAAWQMPTSARPSIDPAEIEAAREDLSELAFAQEYEAKFVTWAGAVFRKIIDCVTNNPTGTAAVIGCDWGRSNDYTVFCVLSDTGSILELDRFRGLEYALQRGRLASLAARYGNPVIVAESNSIGGPVIEQLARDGVNVKPFVTTNATKAAIVEQLALAFEQNTISIPHDLTLIGELQAFEASALPSGLMRYAAPVGGHDDCVMALAIAFADLEKVKRAANRWPADVDPFGGSVTELSKPSPWSLDDVNYRDRSLSPDAREPDSMNPAPYLSGGTKWPN